MSKRESQIQKEILIAITALPCAFFERMNTGAAVAGNRFIRFGTPGAPDIRGCYRGRSIAIECKTARGKLRPEQKIWREAHEKAGGIYIIGRDAAEVLRELEALPWN